MENTIKTRLLLLSDTHNTTPHPPPSPHPYRHPLPKAHILIHAGDLTTTGTLSQHKTTLSLLKSAPAELKLVIAGNHDITLDEKYYAAIPDTSYRVRHGREDIRAIRELYTSPEAYEAGIRYLDEGMHMFTLSTGARVRVFASPYTPAFCGWAFAYPRGTDRFNPPPAEAETPAEADEAQAAVPAEARVPDFPSVDIMITHGPPASVLDTVVHGASAGCEALYTAVKRARPRLHVFGHIHEGYGALRVEWKGNLLERTRVEFDEERVRQERSAYVDVSSDSKQPLRFGEETLFVNASVMDVRYRALNAPWVVDLDLPLAS